MTDKFCPSLIVISKEWRRLILRQLMHILQQIVREGAKIIAERKQYLQLLMILKKQSIFQFPLNTALLMPGLEMRD